MSSGQDLDELKALLESQQDQIKELQEQASLRESEALKQAEEDAAEPSASKLAKVLTELGYGKKNPPESPKSPFEKYLEFELQAEGPKEDTDTTTDDIPATLAQTLVGWFCRIHSGSEIQEALRLCKRPANADALKIVSINEEVRKSMSRQDDIKDQRLKWLCCAIVKSVQPLTVAYATLTKLEHAIKRRADGYAPDQPAPDAMIPLDADDNEINLSQVIRDLRLSLKCIGMSSVQALQKRRLDLQYKLSGAAKELAEPGQPFDDTLFGPNLKKHFNDILALNKLTHKVSSPKKSRGNHFTLF